MLNNATCFKEVYIVCGRTDLRSGIDRLAAAIKMKRGNNAFRPDVIYLFCGRRGKTDYTATVRMADGRTLNITRWQSHLIF